MATTSLPAALGSHPQETGAQTAISVRQLWKRYGTTEAVRGISFDVRRGEIFGLIGPDGAGKTTTFQILAGVMEATSGTADVFGRPARETRSQTGYLTQTFSLYPDLSVSENIRYIGDLRRVPVEAIEERANRYLQMFDMDRFKARLAGRLSGGMKQKLSLVSALVPEPHILLLDEPTTGVDPVSRREWSGMCSRTSLADGPHDSRPRRPIWTKTPNRCHRVRTPCTRRGAATHIGTPSPKCAFGNARQAARTAHPETGPGRGNPQQDQRPGRNDC